MKPITKAEGISSFSLNKINGCYLSQNGKLHNETSFSLSIFGVEPIFGTQLARALRQELIQESVLLKIGNNKKLITF